MNFTKLLLSVFAGVCLLVSSTGSIKTEVPKFQDPVAVRSEVVKSTKKKLTRKERHRLARERRVNDDRVLAGKAKGFFWGLMVIILPQLIVIPAIFAACFIVEVFGFAAFAGGAPTVATGICTMGICLSSVFYCGYKSYEGFTESSVSVV